MRLDTAFTTRAIATNGIRLHVVEAGPEDGPLVLLLHGFPEFWYGWHPPSLAFCDQGRAVYLEEATHWVVHEEPEAVSRLLVEHFGRT